MSGKVDVFKTNGSETSILHTMENEAKTWISDEVCRIFEVVVLAVTCQIVAVLGTVGNMINIVCFVKQGFQDSVNVNLLGLAVSDMGCLIIQILLSIAFNPLFKQMDKPFDISESIYLTIGWPRVVFARMTSFITAFVTLERCFCIIIPLKVKTVITPRRAGLTIAGMFVVLIICLSPIYCVSRMVWIYSQEQNRTLLVLTFTPDRDIVEAICNVISNFTFPLVAFLTITVCTCVLVIGLKKKSRWREKSTTLDNGQELSKREQKVGKMVVVISSMFIASYFPVCVMFICMLFLPNIAVGGKDVNVSVVIGGLGVLLESINASVNIFIYYNMSSRYKLVFRQLCGVSPQSMI